MQRFSCVILVDARGWLLLQERDEHPVIDPERWGLTGGHVEPGEDVESAAYRELAEETGIEAAPGSLTAFDRFEVFHPAYDSLDAVHVWVAPTTLADADVECHEGRRIVFVDPATCLDLPLTTTASIALPALLDSDLYRGFLAPGRGDDRAQ